MDPELVTKAQAGDRVAFAAVAGPLYPRLLRVASSIMRDPSAAEDATQQAVLDVWRNLPGLRDPQRFESWCFRVLTNACRNEGRRRRRWLRDATALFTLQPEAPDGLADLEDRDLLERCFERLSDEHRTVLVLHHVADMTQAQIAATLQVSPGTVRSRHHRALEALRAAMAAETRAPIGDQPRTEATE